MTTHTEHRPPPSAERLATRIDAKPTPRGSKAATALHEIGEVDLAAYRSIATTPTPTLDESMRRLSNSANHSRLWIMLGLGMHALGGRKGRRAALAGGAALAVNSAIVNLPLKLVARRARPDWDGAGVPTGRRVRMPASASFPSGHSASGFAFANAVGETIPAAALPLRMLACAVGYSRVHTGVHYPGDVVVGALIGATIGEGVGWALRRAQPDGGLRLRWPRR